MYKKICLFGAGGHGKVVASQMLRAGHENLYFGDGTMPIGNTKSGLKINVNNIASVINDHLIITIGSNHIRRKLQTEAELNGCPITSFITDQKHYYSQQPGAGSMILAGAIVTCDSNIGKGVIINTGAIVEHDCTIGDFCHLAPGSVIAGGATLGSDVLLGANATVLTGVSVASGTTIGAGAVVTNNIDVSGTYVGVPARLVNGH